MTPSPATSQPRSLTLVDEPTLDKECPLCEQPISQERLREIKAKLEADQAQQAKELEEQLRSESEAAREEARLRHELEMERASADFNSRLEAAQEEASAREVRARAEARAEADAEKEAAVAAAREAENRLAKSISEADAREAAARNAGREATLLEVAEQLKRAEDEKETKAIELASTVAELESAKEQVKVIHAETDERVELAGNKAREEALAEAAERITAIEAERDRMNAEKSSLAQQVGELKDGREEAVAKAIVENSREVREALEEEHRAALAKKDAEAFAEKQRLQKDLDDVTRRLARKTADELGEGAEVDLFNTLLGAFPTDTIERIKKGEAGADVRHTVMSDGQTCGKILYDSKNRRQWRTLYAAKLRTDQMADRADHAILASRAFPANTSQLCIRDGVIVANPARVLPVVQILRTSMIEVHRLRISAEEREMKTKAIYDFITSPRFTKYIDRLVEIASGLAELDAKEKKSHDRVWQDRGILTQALTKATADLNVQVNSILQG